MQVSISIYKRKYKTIIRVSINQQRKTEMLKIDHLDLDNHQVYFSSPMSSFRADYQIHEYEDVAVNGEIETPITGIDVTVRNKCHVFIDADGTRDGDVVLDTTLTDDMCREVANLISDMLKDGMVF